jgi:hypothetical protein
MNTLRRGNWPLLLVLLALTFVMASAYRGRRVTAAGAPTPPAETQDLTSLERRISMLEQRFYGVESSINRLEQQTRGSQPMPASTERAVEINLLRGEMEMLQRRLIEIECGLTRLDERTLAPAAREARRRAGAGNTDPCRLNTDAPLRLSARP